MRPDGRPHVTPLIAVWLDDAIWFTTDPDEVKARNLVENAACTLTTGCADLAGGALDVVLEGTAEDVREPAALELLAGAFAAKYGTDVWHFVLRDGVFRQAQADGRVLAFRVRPARAFGFRKGDVFSQTTWRFPE